MANETKSAKRIYVVSEEVAGNVVNEWLVKATSQAQAIAHVVKGRFTAEAANVEAIIRLKDKDVQEAGQE